jgi:hypothetical protein
MLGSSSLLVGSYRSLGDEILASMGEDHLLRSLSGRFRDVCL